MVVTRERLFGINGERYFQGFKNYNIYDFENIILKYHFFKKRNDVENDGRYKQIIPYIIFRNKNRFFVYKRLKSSNERRLHNLYSIGIGGHINPSDNLNNDIIVDAMKREFSEEIDYPYKYNYNIIGYINNDSTPVDKVHFGVVFLVDGSSSNIKVKENDKIHGKLMRIEEINRIEHNFERWSKIVWNWLKRTMGSRGVPSFKDSNP